MENLPSHSGLYKNVHYNADSINVNFSQVFLEILMLRAKWILTTVIFSEL